MKNNDPSKIIFFAALSFFGLFLAFSYGAIAYRSNLFPVAQIKQVYNEILLNPSALKGPKYHHLQPTRNAGDGVTVNKIDNNDDNILLIGFFDDENQARLIKRNGEVVKKWSLDYFEHFPDRAERPCNDLNSPLEIDMHGGLLTPKGELVFNYEYCGTVKLDQCGNVMWTLNKLTHHSLVEAEKGGYWIMGRDKWAAKDAPNKFPPFTTAATDDILREDTILRVAEDGTIIDEFSLVELMYNSGMEAILTADGLVFSAKRIQRLELVHSNQATELKSDIAASFAPLFSAGDLAISIRELNLVFVIDPDTKAVKWHQTGPWLRQHDAEFRPDGRLSIFNNNTYRTAYPHNNQTDLTTDFTTNIIVVDPKTGETEVVFGEKPGQEMLSVIRGQHELLEDDGILIVEFDAGRVLQVNAAREIVWEYVNKYDDNYVGEITNAHIYQNDYFDNEWAVCE